MAKGVRSLASKEDSEKGSVIFDPASTRDNRGCETGMHWLPAYLLGIGTGLSVAAVVAAFVVG